MKAPNKIEIDAQAAFIKIGVDLRISPIAEQCVESLRQQLMRCITPQLVVAALADAARAGKSRRGRKKSVVSGGTEPGGHTDER